jgi:hypothetical protein
MKPRKPRGGVEVYLYSFFNLGARWWVGGQRHAPTALPPGLPGTNCVGDWVGHSEGLEGYGIPRIHKASIPGPSSLLRVAIPTSYPCPSCPVAFKIPTLYPRGAFMCPE